MRCARSSSTLSATNPGAELAANRVAELIGLAEAAAGAEEGFVAVRELFEALARDQPVVIVFDDIHWGEATFLDLVEHLADWVRDAPVLLVCLARPELLRVRPGWGGGKLNATVALLEPLSDEECSQLIENLVGRAELAGEVGTRIAESAEGNPLFVEEMLSMLIDDGLLIQRERPLVSDRRHLRGARASHDSGAARCPARPARRERTSRDRAGLGSGQGLLGRSSHRPLRSSLCNQPWPIRSVHLFARS